MENIEQKSLRFSLAGSVFFALLGFGFAIYTGSQAILLDGIWDLLAVILGITAIVVAKMISRPATDRMPFGYSALEPFYIILKGFVGFVLTVFVIINNVIIAFNGGNLLDLGVVVIYISIAISGNLLIYLVLRKRSGKINSPAVQVEKEGWFVNLMISSGVGLAFVLVFLFGNDLLSPVKQYIDQIVAISVGLFTLVIPVKQIKSGFSDLLLVAPELTNKSEIEEIIQQNINTDLISRYQPYFLKTGRKIWITVFVKPRKKLISARFIDKLKISLEHSLEDTCSMVNVDVIPTNKLV